MSRRICVVTGTRAEYGLLKFVMQGIAATPGLELQVIATGMHLAEKFGLTYRDIEADGFTIDRKVAMDLASDAAPDLTRALGQALASLGAALAELKPDIVVVLGDRYEIFAAAAAAMIARIPIAHLHGGEATEGLIDEPIRHSVTKMSHFHFVAAEAYRDRVVQLGEQPARVFTVGGLGVDGIKRTPRLDAAELARMLGIRWRRRNLLITFHPVTLEHDTAAGQMAELLGALAPLDDTTLVFTMPNADPGGAVLFDTIETFTKARGNAHVFTSLGQQRYLSCMAVVDGVVGNSSSGLIEAPSMGKGTVNIGDRQRGRIKAASVIDCTPTRAAIAAAIGTLYSEPFRETLAAARNPYGDGGASERVVEILASVPLDGVLKKRFHDIAVS